jgi:hypothetical protein
MTDSRARFVPAGTPARSCSDPRDPGRLVSRCSAIWIGLVRLWGGGDFCFFVSFPSGVVFGDRFRAEEWHRRSGSASSFLTGEGGTGGCDPWPRLVSHARVRFSVQPRRCSAVDRIPRVLVVARVVSLILYLFVFLTGRVSLFFDAHGFLVQSVYWICSWSLVVGFFFAAGGSATDGCVAAGPWVESFPLSRSGSPIFCN